MSVSDKRVAEIGAPRVENEAAEWLNLDAVAAVTIVCGKQRLPRGRDTWCVNSPGEQTIEIRFYQPTSLRRLRVVMSEFEHSRTQEMTVWASLHRGEQHHEVVRQQFNFSPGGATTEVEDYTLDLEAVSSLELRIIPSIDGSPAVARVTDLRLAAS